jgi:ATP-binding cassette, subfamily A (ABC1), member 3
VSKFGGPIVYLIGWIILLFAVLVYVDSGTPVPRFMRFSRHLGCRRGQVERRAVGGDDVANEEKRVADSKDELRVLGVSKAFKGSRKKAVDDVSFGISKETFTILGPNGVSVFYSLVDAGLIYPIGAGKTTTFNIIRT